MPLRPKLGPTGRFPQGKLNDQDEGELRCAITIERDQVKIMFGKSVEWLSLPANSARQLAMLLLDRADKIDGGVPD